MYVAMYPKDTMQDILSLDWARVYDAPTLKLTAEPLATQQALNSLFASSLNDENESPKGFIPKKLEIPKELNKRKETIRLVFLR
jgi:hypothetical protein